MSVLEVRQTVSDAKWFSKLADRQAKARILARIRRLQMGNPGDVKALSGGVSEIRIHCGPGYRVYFCRSGGRLVILLAGGDKSSQKSDLKRARQLASNLESGDE